MAVEFELSGPDQDPLITGGMPSQLVDTDPEESAEWRASFDALLENAGPTRAR